MCQVSYRVEFSLNPTRPRVYLNKRVLPLSAHLLVNFHPPQNAIKPRLKFLRAYRQGPYILTPLRTLRRRGAKVELMKGSNARD